MGIRFNCPNGHRLNVKDHLAGKRGVCPSCGAKFTIPTTGAASDVIVTAPPSLATAPEDTIPAIGDPKRSTDADPPSMLIAVTDSCVTPVPPPALSPEIVAPAASPTAPPTLDFSPIPAAVPTESPEASYLAKRQRSRRMQVKLAIALLVAVVVLAVVLVWVLRRGPVGPTAHLDRPTYLAHSPATAYVAEAQSLG